MGSLMDFLKRLVSRVISLFGLSTPPKPSNTTTTVTLNQSDTVNMTYLQRVKDKGATHLWALDRDTKIKDYGSAPKVEGNLVAGTTYQNNNPLIMGGGSKRFKATSGYVNMGKKNTINEGNDIWRVRSTMVWVMFDELGSPTCVWGVGGGTNNQILAGGIGDVFTWQAADSGEDFLICHSNFSIEPNKLYCVVTKWIHSSLNPDNKNSVEMWVNGVFQQRRTRTVTAVFPSHTGSLVIGNTGTGTSYRSYNGHSIKFALQDKSLAYLALFNDEDLTGQEIEELYVAGVTAEFTVEADTIENQQDFLDNLIQKDFSGANLALRIYAATDAGEGYTLLLDGFNFDTVKERKQIHVQYVGKPDLKIYNCNGSNAEVVEYLDSVESFPGNVVDGSGGSVTRVDNVIRLKQANMTYTNVNADIVVLDAIGSFTFDGGIIGALETWKGDVEVSANITIPSLVETAGGITLEDTIVTFVPLTGYTELTLYTSLEGAVTINADEAISSGLTFSYASAQRGGSTLYYRMSKPSGEVSISSIQLPSAGGAHEVPLLVSDTQKMLLDLEQQTEQILKKLNVITALTA